MPRRRREPSRKKLEAAARAIAVPPRARGGFRVDEDDPNAASLLAYLKAREAEAGSVTPKWIEIAPDEVDALTLFQTLQTQWSWHPVAGARTGLTYASIPAAAAMAGIAMSAVLFLDIRMMEAAALSAWARAS